MPQSTRNPEYHRESHSVWFFFGRWLPAAECIKQDPDAARLVQETIEQMEAVLHMARYRWNNQIWPCDRNQVLFLQWALEGERKLLQEITETRH
jgi:hypothetical protein